MATTSDIEEFGTDVQGGKYTSKQVEEPEVSYDEKQKKKKSPLSLQQWSHFGSDSFLAAGKTEDKLPPGMYTIDGHVEGNPIFKRLDIKVDDLIRFKDSISDQILSEIETFWTRKEFFKKYGFLHRRGYLLYGPQGSGKSTLIHQIIKDVTDQGDLVLLYSKFLPMGLNTLRQVEPNRRLVCIFEDVDAIIRDYGEDKILSILDGENQIDRVLNIATTNYPGRLDKRIVSRPRRFDRVIKIGPPGAEIRREYLKLKLKVDGDDIEEWIKKTDGLSFAALAETVISVKCLGNELDKTVDTLLRMSKNKFSDAELEAPVGFGSNGNR